MIRILIPSLDRPAQLELLLRSLRENWSIDELDIKVLCKWSNQKFWDGYMEVVEEFPNIDFQKEEFFGAQIKHWIDTANKVVGFFTDDSIFFRKTVLSPSNIDFILSGNVITVSLRLGLNTCVQNYLDGSLQPSLEGHYQEILDNAITWKWNRFSQQCNYNYPFSWDGHFYDKQWLWSLVKDKQFESPRALEHQLSIDPALRDISKPYMASCMTSSVFVNTINRVQPNGPAAGTKYPYSTEMLNEKFLSGQRISLESFAHQSIISCHEEIPLKWE